MLNGWNRASAASFRSEERVDWKTFDCKLLFHLHQPVLALRVVWEASFTSSKFSAFSASRVAPGVPSDILIWDLYVYVQLSLWIK